jgi:ankyrin repeat protein
VEKTALEYVVSCGDLELVYTLDAIRQHFLRLNARNVNSWTHLDTAIRMAHGADVAAHGRRYGTTPLALAVLTAQHDVIRMLLATGADVWALHKIKGDKRKLSVLFKP